MERESCARNPHADRAEWTHARRPIVSRRVLAVEGLNRCSRVEEAWATRRAHTRAGEPLEGADGGGDLPWGSINSDRSRRKEGLRGLV